MLLAIFNLLCVAALSGAVKGPCDYDGKRYNPNDVIMMPNCLGSMRCVGDNNYDNLEQFGGVCPDEKRDIDGQTGCWFNGKVYSKDEQIIIQPCEAIMTCKGNNLYSDPISLGGVCQQKREANGQTGCDYDGKLYSAGDVIYSKGCLAKFTCLGNNVISEPKLLGGQC